MSQDYEVHIQPQGGRFRCQPQQTLLDAALAAGYWLPHSCREGTCGSCHLALLAGSVRYRESAPGVADLSPSVCKTCQATPLTNVVLDAPGVPAEPGGRIVKTSARVIKVVRPSSDVTIVHARAPAAAGFRFKAGQYADVILKDGARRSFSMANAPDENGAIEWHIRHLPGGRFSEHAYNKLKVGDMLRIEGPFGSFSLRHGDAPIVFLASGTGYAPIAAMLNSHLPEIARRGATVYWGGRSLADLYGLQSVEDWEQKYRGVRIVPVLSDFSGVWTGKRGLVHRAVLEDLPDLSKHEVYACGNPLMIDAARHDFSTLGGLAGGRFYCDAFFPRS